MDLTQFFYKRLWYLTGRGAIQGIARHLENARDQLDQCVQKRLHYSQALKLLLSDAKTLAPVYRK